MADGVQLGSKVEPRQARLLVSACLRLADDCERVGLGSAGRRSAAAAVSPPVPSVTCQSGCQARSSTNVAADWQESKAKKMNRPLGGGQGLIISIVISTIPQQEFPWRCRHVHGLSNPALLPLPSFSLLPPSKAATTNNCATRNNGLIEFTRLLGRPQQGMRSIPATSWLVSVAPDAMPRALAAKREKVKWKNGNKKNKKKSHT